MRTAPARLAAIALGALIAVGCSKSGSSPTIPKVQETLALTSVNGATSPSGSIGSTVVLEGQAFGAVQDSSKVLFEDSLGEPVAATIASPADWSDTFIITTVPAGTVTGPVRVQTASGTSDSLTFTVTQNPAFSPSTIQWSATAALPAGVSGHAAAYATLPSPTGGVIYVTGGEDSTGVPNDQVLMASVQAGGQLGPWTPTASLPAALAFHASVVATPSNSRVTRPGYLFVLGGMADSTGQTSSAIYRGTLNADGTVATWAAAGSLPAPMHAFGAVLYRGDLYIAGGAAGTNAPLDAVYRSRIDSTGALGAWQPQPALPSARSHFALEAFGVDLYALGGETGTVSPNDSSNTQTSVSDIVYAPIDLRTGNLSGLSWTPNASTLTKAVSKHTVELAGGYALVTGGLYNGDLTGSTEESYGQFNVDGSVGPFAGATGTHTIQSAGGGNLFNQAALSYLDPAGAIHVLVVGGDDLNHPGRKHAQVWFH